MDTLTIHDNEPEYPVRLRQCPDRPSVLYGIGNLNLNEGPFLAVVGTRQATELGKEVTRNMILALAERIPTLTIVSGLAYGIDIAAHKAALEAGLPTIAVLGHGLDRIYPPLHRPVAVKMLTNGGLVTEYPLNAPVSPHNFSDRDRIIAALADATLVIESPFKGGSLITARMASDYGRPLFAIPGRVSDKNSEGCNNLIRDGKAQLVTSAEDIIRFMQWETQPLSTQMEMENLFDTLDEIEQKLLIAIRKEENGIHINELVLNLKEPYSTVSATLMMLELKGFARSLPGGIYRALK